MDASIPRLRLVGTEQHLAAKAARAVARENRAAATLDPADARRIFAASVAGAFEPSRPGSLAPSTRRSLMRVATRLGLRDFDANLVIAIMQDDARTGRGAGDDDGRLAMVSAPRAPRAAERTWLWAGLASIAGAVVLFAAIVRWLLA